MSSGKFLLVGASRGLGWATAQNLKGTAEGLIVSRKEPHEKPPKGFQWSAWDANHEDAVMSLVEIQKTLGAERLIYFVGGGPFGPFQKKEWKDHAWAWNVSFQTPARLLHSFLRMPLGLRQITFIGSAIAGEKPDPEASSYCAAKHALQGLVTSIQEEQRHLESSGTEALPLDLRLYSPGYMDTGLLPKNAWPRYRGKMQDPNAIARDLSIWIQDPSQARCHRQFI